MTLTSLEIACQCGADHMAVVREELAVARLDDQALHPWRYDKDREDAGIPFWNGFRGAEEVAKGDKR